MRSRPLTTTSRCEQKSEAARNQTTCDAAAEHPPYRVVCVCAGEGFPLGSAAAAKIVNVGRTLQAAGLEFSLLHCGPSSVPVNTQRKGEYEGVRFEYTGSVRRHNRRSVRLAMYVWAVAVLTLRLVQLRSLRPRVAVYLYVLNAPLAVYVNWLCRAAGLPVVQDVCEWCCPAFSREAYRKRILGLATGALVISRAIEQRVLEGSRAVNRELLMYRLPSIVDTGRFAATESAGEARAGEAPTFMWCGTMNGWILDVEFMIRALALVGKHFPCKLKLVGTYNERSRDRVLDCAKSLGVPEEDIILTGCVDQPTLEACYRQATALLLPLRNDERSITRLPNKLGEYLASGRPVISCNIGDLTEFLFDDVNAYLAEPGSVPSFAERMTMVLRDPVRAEQIGAAGRQACLKYLDYSVHVDGLASFFVDCIQTRR